MKNIKEIKLPLREGFLTAELPPSWEVCQILESPLHESIDVEKLLKEALADPIGALPPSSVNYDGKDICVIVDDATRPTPVNEIFPVLLEILQSSGASKERITVLVATGTHAPMPDKALFERLGIEAADGLNIINHNCWDDSNLADLGTTPLGLPLKLNRLVVEADYVFSIGTIEPHIMAGFGGGYKNIVPGCAGLETVQATHLLGPASERFGNVGKMPDVCSVRMRIDDAASMAVPSCFVINTVLDFSKRPVGLFCGEAMEAHRLGCLLAGEVWGVPLKEKAEIVIGSSYPMTHDLCQGSKAFAMGVEALRPGGLVLLLLSCEHGLGDYCVSSTKMSYDEVKNAIREHGTEHYVELKKKEKGSELLPFYEVFLTQSNSEALRKAEIFVYSPDIPYEVMNSFGLFRAFPSMESMIAEAGRIFPNAKVVVSPCAGACYPRG